MPGPFHGIRIVDLSIALSGPWATTILADQGADVIKIEPPGIGDVGRWVGVAINGISAMFQMANRGKRSLVLDLKRDEAREIVRRLARDADVFVENFRPGVIERLGLDYETLRAERDDLIYVSISGFGHEGPYAQKSAYDNVVQAYAGLAASQADADGRPRFFKQIVSDKVSALTASQAIAAALFARERGAGGQHVRLAMLEANVSFLWCDAAGNEVLLDSDGSLPSAFMAALEPFRFKDGWGTCSPVSDANFHGMCRALGVEGSHDPAVATIAQRRSNPAALAPLMEKVYAACLALTVDEAMKRLEAEDVPCGPMLRPDQLADDPHVRAIGMLEESRHPAAGRIRQPRPAARFASTPSRTGAPAPSLGQHSDEILREIGWGDRIEALRAGGVIG